MSDNDWIEWHGGHRPVHPDVVVQYRTGLSAGVDSAGALRWQHTGSGTDIIAYRKYVPAVASDTPPPEEAPSMPQSAPSGLNGSYYDIRLLDGRIVATQDIIEALGLNFAQGNILKSVVRMGRKPGVAERYDAEKVVYYGTRELKRAGG